MEEQQLMQKRYYCDVCMKTFANKHILKRHMTCHTGDFHLQCKVCHKNYNRTDMLKLHMLSHTNEKPHACQTCGKRFNHPSKLKRHMITHSEDKPFSCNICGKKASSPGDIKKHMRVHTRQNTTLSRNKNVEKVDEDLCEKSAKFISATNTDILGMQDDCNGDDECSSDSCARNFEETRSRDNHINSVTVSDCFDPMPSFEFSPSLSNVFKENTKVTKSNEGISEKLKSKIENSKPKTISGIMCIQSDCNADGRCLSGTCVANSEETMCRNNHIDIGTVYDPVIQSSDDPPSLSKALKMNLRNEKATKVNVDIWEKIKSRLKCKVCFKNFKRADSLKLHMLLHTDEKPYACQTCGKRFVLPSKLKKHMIIHSEDKPFSCNICGKKALKGHHMQEHMRVHIRQMKEGRPVGPVKLKSKIEKSQPKTSDTCVANSAKIMSRNNPIDIDTVNDRLIQSSDNIPKGSTACKINLRNKKATKVNIENCEKIKSRPMCESRFKCKVCYKTFTRAHSLKLHGMLYHTDEKPYACQTCGKGFVLPSKLKRHMITHSEDKPFSCNICGKKASSPGDIKKHMRVHTRQIKKEKPEGPVKPSVNTSQTVQEQLNSTRNVMTNGDIREKIKTKIVKTKQANVSDLKQNTSISRIKNVEKVDEDLCEKSANLILATNTDILGMQDDCNGVDECSSVSCARYLEETRSRDNHIKSITVNDCLDPIPCFELISSLSLACDENCNFTKINEDICEKLKSKIEKSQPKTSGMFVSNSAKTISTNDQNDIGTESRLKCKVCFKTFTRAYSLKLHSMLYHTDEKPYACQTCGKRFVLPSKLKKHMITHSEDKPFSCNICGKKASAPSDIKKHMRVHTRQIKEESNIAKLKPKQISGKMYHTYYDAMKDCYVYLKRISLSEMMLYGLVHGSQTDVDSNHSEILSLDSSKEMLERDDAEQLCDSEYEIEIDIASENETEVFENETKVDIEYVNQTEAYENETEVSIASENEYKTDIAFEHETAVLQYDDAEQLCDNEYEIEIDIASDNETQVKIAFENETEVHVSENETKVDIESVHQTESSESETKIYIAYENQTEASEIKTEVDIASENQTEVDITSENETKVDITSENGTEGDIVSKIETNVDIVSVNQTKASENETEVDIVSENETNVDIVSVNQTEASENETEVDIASEKETVVDISSVNETLDGDTRSHFTEDYMQRRKRKRIVDYCDSAEQNDDIETHAKRYTCQVCKKCFSYKRCFRRHKAFCRQRQHLIKNKQLRTSERLKAHKQTIQTVRKKHDKSLLCDVCGKTFPRQAHVELHLETHNSGKNILCSICGKGFKYSRLLDSHMLTHSDSKPFKCDQCGYNFRWRNNLKTHLRRGCNWRRLPFGTDPSKSFPIEDTMKKQVNALIICPDEVTFACDICSQVSKSAASFVKHYNRHTTKQKARATGHVDKGLKYDTDGKPDASLKEKPECEICGQAVTRKTLLKDHYLAHTNEMLYSCKVCSRRFRTRVNVRLHVKFHLKADMVPCTICRRLYKTRESLRKHKEWHDKEEVGAADKHE